MSTKVVNCYKDKDPSAIYIGRGSPWGNPYSDKKDSKALYIVGSREEAIESYRRWLFEELLHDPEFAIRLLELEGHKLACFCKPLACHGDVIVKAIEWLRALKETATPHNNPRIERVRLKLRE